MRWLSALLLCGFLALASTVALQPPRSLAMQETPTPPSEQARGFCLPENEIPFADLSILQPSEETAGSVPVIDIESPSLDEDNESDTAHLNLTIVTLPVGKCILGSWFYPSMLMTVTSGQVSLFIEHWPGVGAAPQASYYDEGAGMPHDLPFDGSQILDAGDWAQITNESFIGFRNEGDEPAIFVVSGIKPDGGPGGGGCSGGCRGQP